MKRTWTSRFTPPHPRNDHKTSSDRPIREQPHTELHQTLHFLYLSDRLNDPQTGCFMIAIKKSEPHKRALHHGFRGRRRGHSYRRSPAFLPVVTVKRPPAVNTHCSAPPSPPPTTVSFVSRRRIALLPLGSQQAELSTSAASPGPWLRPRPALRRL